MTRRCVACSTKFTPTDRRRQQTYCESCRAENMPRRLAQRRWWHGRGKHLRDGVVHYAIAHNGGVRVVCGIVDADDCVYARTRKDVTCKRCHWWFDNQ